MATKKYLDYGGLSYFWTKIKLWVANYAKITIENGVTKITIGGSDVLPVQRNDNISLLTNDANYITLSQVPEGATASNTTPKVDSGDGIKGTETTTFARGDHQHPLNVSTGNPLMDGTASAGTSTAYARSDHKHPSDTSKLSLSGGTMTGTLTLHAAPTTDLLAATKKYVDDNKITNNNLISNGAGYQTAQQVSDAITTALSSTMTYKGTVTAVSDLPTTNNKNGDVYHVTADRSEYAWNGTSWEELGRDLSGFLSETDAITNPEIDTITADTTIPATT